MPSIDVARRYGFNDLTHNIAFARSLAEIKPFPTQIPKRAYLF